MSTIQSAQSHLFIDHSPTSACKSITVASGYATDVESFSTICQDCLAAAAAIVSERIDLQDIATESVIRFLNDAPLPANDADSMGSDSEGDDADTGNETKDAPQADPSLLTPAAAALARTLSLYSRHPDGAAWLAPNSPVGTEMMLDVLNDADASPEEQAEVYRHLSDLLSEQLATIVWGVSSRRQTEQRVSEAAEQATERAQAEARAMYEEKIIGATIALMRSTTGSGRGKVSAETAARFEEAFAPVRAKN